MQRAEQPAERGRHPARQLERRAEVEHAEPAVGQQQEVAGVRVGVQQPRPRRTGDQEALVQLRCARPDLLVAVPGDRRQRPAVEPLHDDDARRRAQHLRHHDVRVVGEPGAEALLRAALALEVELLDQPVAQLAHQRRGGHAAGDECGGPGEQRQRADVADQRLAHAGVLHLHRDRPPVGPGRPVHLGDRRGGDRGLVEVGQQRAPVGSEVAGEDRLDLGEGQRLDPGLQPGEGLAPGLLGVVRQQRLDRRQQLTGLERTALEPAEDAGRPRGAPLARRPGDGRRVLAPGAAHRARRGVGQRAARQLQQTGGPDQPCARDGGGRHPPLLPADGPRITLGSPARHLRRSGP